MDMKDSFTQLFMLLISLVDDKLRHSDWSIRSFVIIGLTKPSLDLNEFIIRVCIAGAENEVSPDVQELVQQLLRNLYESVMNYKVLIDNY